MPAAGRSSKVVPEPALIEVEAVSKLYPAPIFPGTQPPEPAVIVPVFTFPAVSFAEVPVFSSSFHSATGATQLVLSPGTQYS